jgi:hypothetical protein
MLHRSFLCLVHSMIYNFGYSTAQNRTSKPMTERRFPPSWTAEVTLNCFIVRDANGQR